MYGTTRTVFIVARKRRSGEYVVGSFRYDGLADLWAVTEDDGNVAYVSCLDEILSWDEVV